MSSYAVAHKHEFISQLRTIPATELPHLLEKIQLLEAAPEPDAKNKKRLHGYKNPVFRVRSGDYRIIYTFKPGLVTLLGVDARKDVYRNGHLIGMGLPIDPSSIPDETEALQPSRLAGDEQGRAIDSAHIDNGGFASSNPALPDASDDQRSADPVLQQAPTESLLQRLRIPSEFWPLLIECRTLDALCEAAVPSWVRDQVFDGLVEPNFDRVIDTGQLYSVDDIDDYRKYYEGSLSDFLLRLDDEQRRFAEWSSNLKGPTLLKGGPGTGKSTIAIYRVRSLVRQPSLWSGTNPRILFTTYTNALTKSSQELLERLIGDDAARVEVKTADSLVRRIYSNHELDYFNPIDSAVNCGHIRIVRDQLSKIESSAMLGLDRINHLSILYLEEEITQVIVSRGIKTFQEYKDAIRKGRQVPLNEAQRRAVWAVYEQLEERLEAKGLESWSHTRRRALQLERQRRTLPRYDGVVIDEAQDLDPNMIRLLIDLCDNPSRLFITADANQSIYGNGFSWKSIDPRLNFQGRSGQLTRSYRSTAEILRAAKSYRPASDDDDLGIPDNNDITTLRRGPLPVALHDIDRRDTVSILERYFTGVTDALGIGLDGCALLVPSAKAGTAFENQFRNQGLPARFMKGNSIDLNWPGIKILPIPSSKGLEFPVVAMSDLEQMYVVNANGSAEQRLEQIDLGRRRVYVGLTRAAHALLILLHPRISENPVLAGFGPPDWLQIEPANWREWALLSGTAR